MEEWLGILKREIDQLPNRSPATEEAKPVYIPAVHNRRVTTRADSGFVDNSLEMSGVFEPGKTVSEGSPVNKASPVPLAAATAAVRLSPDDIAVLRRRKPPPGDESAGARGLDKSVQRLSLNCEDLDEQRDIINTISPRISAVIQAFYVICSSRTQNE